MKRSRGFTLIELLAVIAILGILISITTVAVNTLRKKQEEKNKENVISSILTGAKEYNAKEKITLSNGKGKVKVNVLKEKSYVDFDEKKYSNFMKDEAVVTKEKCDNPLKIKYSIKVDDTTYNDCGCETQDNGNTKSKELCTE